jgi:hypothetical protein
MIARFLIPRQIRRLTLDGTSRTISRIFQTAASLTASDPTSPDPDTYRGLRARYG